MAPETRWTEVTPSQFPHEAEGLSQLRKLLPNTGPFRAWSNFEFRDGQGKWHEIDLVVLGRRRLHLVELKYYTGTLSGDDHSWLRDGRRAEDSPLKLARRKAQRLRSRLGFEMRQLAREENRRLGDIDDHVPYIQEAVHLHHPDLRCALPPSGRIDLFGLDGPEAEARSGLEGISTRLLESPTPYQHVDETQEADVVRLMARIGAVRRRREVGSWTLDSEPLADGSGWQDWPATHRVAGRQRARIRFHVIAPGAAAPERERVSRLAEHEYRVMSRLSHDRLLRPIDIVDDELGTGLVYPDDSTYQRLDLWLAEHGRDLTAAEQLAIIRQIAEALAYAHANGVVHRGLTPSAIRVLRDDAGEIKVLVADWQAAGLTPAGGLAGSVSGVTDLMADDEQSERSDGELDPDRRLAGAFQAPEGQWSPTTAERVRLDLFALGALAYYVVAGRPPATDRQSLRVRVVKDGGLDLAADLPQVPTPLRTAVLNATRPQVSDRLGSIQAFLTALAEAERVVGSTSEAPEDPLEAAPGAILGSRWRLERRLGSGSTAVALLVTDLQVGHEGPDSVRVLKVALDDAAARRLDGEAEVLRQLSGPRVVKLIDGPIDIGDRRVLVLESAGDETLAEALRERRRLSLDLLDRWGTELLETLVILERAGVHHRDLKPSNLGVREGRGDRRKHLVLFDFSLARAGQSAVRAGTPPYLDPFLDEKGRGFDSAAERYSATVVLFQMATGSTPLFGDGLSDPAVLRVQATVEKTMFDDAIADKLLPFFREGLAREPTARFHTAADMHARWRAIFDPSAGIVTPAATELVAAADTGTPLGEAGLSPRALSAVEPLGVATVGDLLAVDAARLSRLSGVSESTRVELREVTKRWRERLGDDIGVTATGDKSGADRVLPELDLAMALLLDHAGTAESEGRRKVARLIVGMDPGVDAFSGQVELAAALGVSRARVVKLMAGLLKAWSEVAECAQLLDQIVDVAGAAIDDLGGVATVAEITTAVRAASGGTRDDDAAPRHAAGLLRLGLDAAAAQVRTHGRVERIATRRRDGRMAVLALSANLIDGVEAVGQVVDDLAASLGSAESLVPIGRTQEALREAFARAAGIPAPGLDGRRLLQLGAALSIVGAVSGRDELHRRDLDMTTALSVGLRGTGATETIGAKELRDRFRARFPALPPLPERPRLDELVREAQLGLRWDATAGGYRALTPATGSQELETRRPTVVPPVAGVEGHIAERLEDSVSRRSFLALGVEARALDPVSDALTTAYGSGVLDLTRHLLDLLRQEAVTAGVPWDAVLTADAAAEGSKAARGLTALLERVWPAVESAIEARMIGDGSDPLLLTNVAPLARYGRLSMLSRWTDLAAPRQRALWLLTPQLAGNQGPVVDGRPLPLAAPSQFLRVKAGAIQEQVSRAKPAEILTP